MLSIYIFDIRLVSIAISNFYLDIYNGKIVEPYRKLKTFLILFSDAILIQYTIIEINSLLSAIRRFIMYISTRL